MSKRIEDPLNAELSLLIPVIYGALISYAVYVVADFIQKRSADVAPDEPPEYWIHAARTWGPEILLLFVFSLFLVEEVGEVVKLARQFPFKRTSRYTHEIFIAGWLLLAFIFIQTGSNLAMLAFGMAVFWGGIWSNQLKEEYKGDPSSVAAFARTQRNFQYWGGLFFVAEAGTFLVRENGTRITPHMAVCFGLTFFVWNFLYALIPPRFHGEAVNKWTVFMLVPDRFMSKAADDKCT